MTFSPITLGARLRTAELAGFVLTETTHQPNHRLPRHNHELPNIAFVLQGSFDEILDRRSFDCQPQSLLIKPAGEAHANRYGTAGMRCLVIEFQQRQLESLRCWSQAFNQVSHFRGSNLSLLGTRIYKEFRLMDAATPLAIEGLMLELVAGLSRRRSPAERQRPRWLDRAREILEADFQENISLTRVAEAVDVHPVHLARVFRKQFTCTPGEFVRQLRINFACRQLSQSDTPLVEIALASGFAHQAHFNRVFKAQTGMTPSEFRTTFRLR
ncbi:MAG TPA: AraC family transcriptional regulator [Pyrinomonadaceae bacterium]|nr:AraC family transcriptional regulator [Pyrinomonadaceae bacterium]